MIRAIETHYAGCRFRSRLEARWAVYFDVLKIKWVYEPEGYVLPNGEWYLPDFWLPQVKMFAEVKPCKFTPAEELRSASLPSPCLMLDGMPDKRSYWTAWVPKNNPPAEGDFREDCLINSDYLDENRFYVLTGADFDDPDSWYEVWMPDTSAEQAIVAARSARFDGKD